MNKTILFYVLLTLPIALFYIAVLALNKKRGREENSVSKHRCPKCGSEIRCCRCNGHLDNCHNLENQCAIEISLYTQGGVPWGSGYCSEYMCRCGHEEKAKS